MHDGYMRKHKRMTDLLIYHAWHTELFARQKTLPDLETLLSEKPKQKAVMTDEQMEKVARLMNAALGGDFVE